MLFLLPSRQAENGRLLSWSDAKNVPWGILLLFGGGLAIAKGFKESGLAQWIGEQLTVLQDVHLLLMILAVVALVLALTEITSNTATATMMYPIMASLALAISVHPYTLMIAAGVAAASAFMLPVATPPNAIVFGYRIFAHTGNGQSRILGQHHCDHCTHLVDLLPPAGRVGISTFSPIRPSL